MSSINFNPFSGNWFPFSKPPNPLPLPPLTTLFNLSQSPSNFASTSLSTTNTTTTAAATTAVTDDDDQPGPFTKMVQQFFWECENLPDYRHTPQVEKILNDNHAFEPNPNATEQEMNENEEFMEAMRNNPVMKFLRRAEFVADEMHEIEMKKNAEPYKKEDRDVWKKVPNVIGLDGRPMPRKSQTSLDAKEKFWDFARQFYLGIWGFWQRPYPSGRPIDAAQAIGYKTLERRYYDFIMKSGVWFYKDRLGRTRGPLALHTLKTAWGGGVIDKNTFIWGEDMDEWAPIHMIYGMERAIATWEVRLGASATAFFHKLQRGIPPWVPLKGFEKKSYKQLQEEAIESKRRDLAVVEANDGMWPGVRIPSHALFLWASGSEMTPTLEQDHMPNKYIPKDLRQQLAKLIPGLRPWEVLSIEQAMDRITFNGEWYREPLGSYNTGPPYIRRWNKDVMRFYEGADSVSRLAHETFMARYPGYDKISKKVLQDFKTRIVEMKKKMKEEHRLKKQLVREERRKK
ncbi:protein TIC 56, chloroplastic-like [Vicia villosa]|uniref:protein TIC 56, chloroplastic-like n=1 Tax=Vicia villosa TaxID=3911 RepID=UPI00273BA5EE|nr:protein TIC 56, chloroplastic-like [Vicia villosa]